MHGRMLSNSPGLYPLDAGGELPAVTNKCVSRHHQVSAEGGNFPSLRITAMHFGF